MTDALAVLNAVRAVPAVRRMDGPPIGGSPLMVGGEQWGEMVDSPIGASPLPGARWHSAEVGQRALALADGVLWSADATRALASVPIASGSRAIATVSPHHGQIRKDSIGAFDAYHGYRRACRSIPALWRHRQAMHIVRLRNRSERAARRPSPGATTPGSGQQRVTCTSHARCPIRLAKDGTATRTVCNERLGVRAWHTLKSK